MSNLIDNYFPTPARLLKGGAVAFGILGTTIVAWALDTWWSHPDTQASQFGFEAPLWPALVVFVVGATVGAITLLWRAANRVQAGEDLYANRHRRRRENDPPDGP